MITGSLAEGCSDHYFDRDMTVYYEGELPSEEAPAAIRMQHGAPKRAWLISERADGGIAEAYERNGVQAQIGPTTMANWENDERWSARYSRRIESVAFNDIPIQEDAPIRRSDAGQAPALVRSMEGVVQGGARKGRRADRDARWSNTTCRRSTSTV